VVWCTPWAPSCFVATGAVSAETVQRFLQTQDERPPTGGGRA
jgi:hypothetical protein